MRRYVALGLVATMLVAPAACGGDGEESAGTGEETSASTPVEGTLSLTAYWTGDEQENFQAVIDKFVEANPDVEVKYTGAGDQLSTRIATAVEGGNPPDIALLPEPGVVANFARRGDLASLEFARETMQENFSQSVLDIGTVDGELYGLIFKAANKSTVWYNVPLFEQAGVEPPATWEELMGAAETITASGVAPYAFGAADGWVLTDLFENIYLRSAGPENYDKLAAHEIPWTDPTVIDALNMVVEIIGNSDNLAGGTGKALQTDFAESVLQTFGDPPEAAMVVEADFVARVILGETKAQPKTGFDVFEFPSINDSPPAIVGGGDIAVMFKDSPAARAFIEYLATPEAAEIWVERGGFSSLNRNVDPALYPDEITRATGVALAEADTFKFDLSDLQPGGFGTTAGAGLFRDFQDLMRDPAEIQEIAERMEAGAERAFSGS